MGGSVMRRLVKDGIDLCLSLGFRLDHDDRQLRTDRWLFTHANEPETVVKFDVKMGELAAQAQIQTAKRIVGLSTSGVGGKRPAKVDARRKAERATERQRREAARLATDARAAEIEARRLVEARQRQVGQLDRLMRGRDDSTPVNLPAGSMLTVDQVADQTGLTDKAVQRAINSGALEAYMCGGQVKVRGADVREWMKAAS